MRRSFAEDLTKLRRRYGHRPGVERRRALDEALVEELVEERRLAIRTGDTTRTRDEKAFDGLMGGHG